MKIFKHFPSRLLLVLLFPLSLLPLPVLYGLTWLTVYGPMRLFGYRRPHILQNLRISFPEKSDREIRKISREFYLHLSRIAAETVWVWTATDRQRQRNCRIGNMEMLNRTAGRSAIVLLGHYGNWEYLKMYGHKQAEAVLKNTYGKNILVIYKAPRSEKAGDILYALRNHKNAGLLDARELPRHLFSHRHELWIYNLIADQCPLEGSRYCTRFLGRDTIWMNGPEVLARRFNLPVYYLSMTRLPGYGRYEARYTLISDTPREEPDGAIIQTFSCLLEADILQHPALWLWSHRRWKRGPETMRQDICKPHVL